MKQTTKSVLYISLITLLITTVVFGFLFTQIMNKGEQLTLLQKDLESELLNEERSRDIRQIVGDTEEERGALTSYFVAQDGVVDFISVVEKMGQDAGVALEISRVDTSSNSTTEVFEDLVIELSATGSWVNVFQMLTLLEHLPYATSIDRISLNMLPERTSAGDWEVIAQLKAIKLK